MHIVYMIQMFELCENILKDTKSPWSKSKGKMIYVQILKSVQCSRVEELEINH
jgi:hypothetical protein